ncbi:MAG: polysaccharide biosynthesis tyrosine autokinase [Burkholderiaceae bacterium]|nr:polysaccharide biosynthesis tyrosine autokinase [Microbacteriaceae bacterium]
MEPHEYLTILRRRWILIVLAGLIGAVAAFGYASTLPQQYRSTTSVYVTAQRGDTSSELVQGSTYTQAQVQSFAQLAQMPQVLNPVIAKLRLDTTARDLAGSVAADIRLNTVIIDISVTNSSPERAAAIADAVGASLALTAEAISPSNADNLPAIKMTTVASAEVASSPVSPNTRLIVLSGLIAGVVLAILYALGRELLDTRVRGEKDLSRVTDLPILGSTARRRGKDSSAIVMRSTPYSPGAEEYRRVATNLEFADVDNSVRSIVVTSALPGEGKSSTSINLALAMAERFQRVLLVDADLRRPSLAEYCQIDGAVGLTSVLVGSVAVTDAIRPWAGGLIDVLPAGIVPANPSQLLGSDAMAELAEALIANYDFVIFDSPPLLPVTDSLLLAKLADGAIIVTRFKSTRRQQVADAVQSLENVNARVFGLLLNGVKPSGDAAYYGYQAEAGTPAADAGEPAEEPGAGPAPGVRATAAAPFTAPFTASGGDSTPPASLPTISDPVSARRQP